MNFVDRVALWWGIFFIGFILLVQDKGYFWKMAADPLDTWVPIIFYFILLPWFVMRSFMAIVFRRW